MYPVKNAFDNIGFGANPSEYFVSSWTTLFISVRQAFSIFESNNTILATKGMSG
jgi:hypothetical protein